MKAMLVDGQKNLIWSEVDMPVIGEEDVLVKIHAAGVNRADLMQRNGEYPSPEGCPPWMGLEIAGEIADMGKTAKEQSEFHIGDLVCTLLSGGGYAEYAAVRHDMLMPVPRGFSMEQAAAIPETYATAYLNLFLEGNLKKEETVFIHAGASGVGIAATQIAKLFGAKVIVSVRSGQKAEAIKAFGADKIVNSRKESLEEVFEENPIDVVIDCVGGVDMGICFSKMNRFGRWIMIAALGGDMTQIDLKTVYQKRLKLIGSTLRSRTQREKEGILAGVKKMLYPYFENGQIRPAIYQVFDMKEAERAHQIVMKNENIGKIILKVK